MMGERNIGFFEESFPANSLRPVTESFVLASVFRVNVKNVLDRLDSILFAAPLTYYYAIYFFKG